MKKKQLKIGLKQGSENIYERILSEEQQKRHCHTLLSVSSQILEIFLQILSRKQRTVTETKTHGTFLNILSYYKL